MTARGKGDEGLAEDLLELAEVDLEPRVNWGPIGDALIAAEAAPDAAKRDELFAEARRLAGTNSSALAFVKTTTDRFSK